MQWFNSICLYVLIEGSGPSRPEATLNCGHAIHLENEDDPDVLITCHNRFRYTIIWNRYKCGSVRQGVGISEILISSERATYSSR